MIAFRRSLATPYVRDYYGGALMIFIGLGVIVQGVQYDVGTLSDMGSGFFPVALGAILVVLGVLLTFSARRQSVEAKEDAVEADERPEWRGWFAIIASIVAFVVIGQYGGLLPASFAIVFISALGDRENTILSALILAAIICVISVVVFWWALQLQFPLFSWG